jgi:hypothetical protein
MSLHRPTVHNSIRFLFLFVPLILARTAVSQTEAGVWQRVYTGEDAVIDFNTSTLQFAEKQVLRIKIRTVLKSPETLRDEPQIKVKTRVETIEFNIVQKVYRLTDVVMFDSSAKVVRTYAVNATDWKRVTSGGMMDRLYYEARGYLPFGSWKVISYRLVEEPNIKPEEVRDLERLIGAQVLFETTYAKVNEDLCRGASYKSTSLSIPELSRQLGAEAKIPEVKSDQVEILSIRCDGSGWVPPESVLVKTSDKSMLMLWKGAFLTLKRD